ncbi:MAG TPA: hypothetical protein VFT12_02890 [Thermoanaerobaculia bacterium]|nr:hypothetical protein [Thermoanaerobaculia bacterium]
MAAAAQSSGQGTSTPSPTTAQQVTLTGCLRQASDDARMFALVASPDANTTTGTSGKMARAPLYRLEDKGAKLKGHTGQRVEVTGTVTPAKDEKGADIIMTRSENIGVNTVTVTTVDLKPAPRLDVTSVRKVADDCPSASRATGRGTTGGADPSAATVGAISEHPERYLNQTVSVTGEVEKVYSPSVFSLDEDRVFSTGVDVLVVSKRPGMAKDNQRMTVTGTVRRFVRAEMQKEIVDFDLRPEWLVDFESRPVIIATDVAIAKSQ